MFYGALFMLLIDALEATRTACCPAATPSLPPTQRTQHATEVAGERRSMEPDGSAFSEQAGDGIVPLLAVALGDDAAGTNLASSG